MGSAGWCSATGSYQRVLDGVFSISDVSGTAIAAGCAERFAIIAPPQGRPQLQCSRTLELYCGQFLSSQSAGGHQRLHRHQDRIIDVCLLPCERYELVCDVAEVQHLEGRIKRSKVFANLSILPF